MLLAISIVAGLSSSAGAGAGAAAAPAAQDSTSASGTERHDVRATRPAFTTWMDLRFRAATPALTPHAGARAATPPGTPSAPTAPGALAVAGPRLSLLSIPTLAAFPQTPDVLSTTPSLSLYRSSWVTTGPAGMRRVELSRADCALKGFGGGASLGLWLGALAMTTNMWDERTSWYVGGAAAAAGALLGGTIGVNNAAWRTNYDWE